jgi:hypothetical protein
MEHFTIKGLLIFLYVLNFEMSRQLLSVTLPLDRYCEFFTHMHEFSWGWGELCSLQ